MSVVNNNSQKEYVFDNFSHFIFSIFPWFYCFHSAEKIKQMAGPDNCKTDPPRRHPAHQDESHRHHDSHHSNDPQLCPHCHCPLLHKAVQMLSVKPCPDKPVMKSSGAFCKAEYSRHIEGALSEGSAAQCPPNRVPDRGIPAGSRKCAVDYSYSFLSPLSYHFSFTPAAACLTQSARISFPRKQSLRGRLRRAPGYILP